MMNLGQIIVQYAYVKLMSLGGAPAGLSFAFLMKKTDLAHEVPVVERNRTEDTLEEIMTRRYRRRRRRLVSPRGNTWPRGRLR